MVWRTTHLTDKSLVCCARLVFTPGSLTDIVTARCDAGARMGENLAKDMISARIGPDFRLAVAGALSDFADRPEPVHPKDLVGHACINFRLPTFGGLYAWEFEENGREIKIRVAGQLVFNNIFNAVEATLTLWPRLCPGGNRPAVRRRGTARARPRGMVALLGRLSPLLPEPPPILTGLRRTSRSPAPPRLPAQVGCPSGCAYARSAISDAPPPILTGPRGTSRAPPTLNYRQSDVRRVALTHDRRSSAIRLPA